MKKRLFLLFAIAAGLVLLAGCKVSGNPLPEGMEEETVLEQGREVVAMLNGGEWQEVYSLLLGNALYGERSEAVFIYCNTGLSKCYFPHKFSSL